MSVKLSLDAEHNFNFQYFKMIFYIRNKQYRKIMESNFICDYNTIKQIQSNKYNQTNTIKPQFVQYICNITLFRINFYLLRTFCPHLGSFCFFCVVSSFTTFRPNFTSGLLQVIFTATSDRNTESCNRIPSNYCLPVLLSIAPRFWPSKPMAGLGRIWNRYLLTMLTWNRRDLTPSW